jgi:hypothetical protein
LKSGPVEPWRGTVYGGIVKVLEDWETMAPVLPYAGQLTDQSDLPS